MNDGTNGNPGNSSSLGDAFRWALSASADPAMAAADWLALDVDDSCGSAVALLTNPESSIRHLQQAKNAFKTMRIVGETTADRRVGARLYAAAIAAALVHHGARISQQSDAAIKRAFTRLVDDASAPEPLRGLAGQALTWLALQQAG